MANIVINEISDNYTYNIGVNSFATVALPITASWGPAVLDPQSVTGTATTTSNGAANFKKSVANTKWLHFPATPQGLDNFLATFRGPSSTYKINKDYSYQMAITLLTAGYDVLVNRVCSGAPAGYSYVVVEATTDPQAVAKGFYVKAKYAGTFGNNVNVAFNRKTYNDGVADRSYWNVVVSVTDTVGNYTAVENFNFVISEPTTWDLPDWLDVLEDVDSKFIVVANGNSSTLGTVADTDEPSSGASGTAKALAAGHKLEGGADERAAGTASADVTLASTFATIRYTDAGNLVDQSLSISNLYITAVGATPTTDLTRVHSTLATEFNYTAAYFAYAQLQDKLQYNPNRIIAPGWDDMNLLKIGGDTVVATIGMWEVAPLQKAITLAAYYGRCGAGLLDIPLTCDVDTVQTYANKLSALTSPNPLENNAPLYNTNYALFAPWGRYKLVGMGKQVHVSPSFLALLIARAQILNQPIQYEWILPTNKKHNLNIGKLDWEVSKATLDSWQNIDEGVSLNVIADIPGLGINVWGNSTLFNVPPATYNALANLSTRYLMNAVENQAYIVSLGITYTYNNSEAVSSYVVGCSPILDTMKNVGAIEDYKIKANPDIDGNDHVNANTLIGKIYMKVFGVVNDIVTDLYALPPTADLSQFGE